ncbi:ATP-dependent DNA ligase [Nocardia otitidiscaviarum]|uniref:ATP-dependent DNA ligase n=1 Tax=Nocardia otitidiscaviarum TaxID=1823 RepID=A0A516NRD4_9NOCA|nr:ATP-dependent DNA ligase [Nocardia otitidiscaviarum]MBF6133372.1 ATP-dependent DNA ligase [Nocardia otitidiscaviarum]MBF6486768.1 ATP-dependent DNA ligase [Nocardia otitidiscaviarum]MCP9625329.1 ATP-dependent DNA ligase [Nocardia otitidiscaviarum]QDP81414.1 ATP-dependent DNA ligase [Nocardia otitidiscaviarum]
MGTEETRRGVRLTNLDVALFDGADATKRDLIDYLEAMADRLIRQLHDRPLSVVRVRPGQDPFMQKNLPKYTPDFVNRVTLWADSAHREVTYALCDDIRTLLWFGNQRAVEYHPTLVPVDHSLGQTHLILDLDPPAGEDFAVVVRAAELVRAALAADGLAGAVKTSGSKGVHIFVPIEPGLPIEDAAAVTRAIAARAERLDPALATTAFIREDRGGKVFLDSTRAAGATVVSTYSPRIRPGTTVSFPVDWADLGSVHPRDFTIHTVPKTLGDRDPWAENMPAPQRIPADLLEEGHTIPVARVQAMHEGKRRARAKRES